MLYADQVTESMQRAIDETARRRLMQQQYNREHGITPETIRKEVRSGIEAAAAAHAQANAAVGRSSETQYITEEYIAELEAEMLAAADELDFERAAALRDRIGQLRDSLGKRLDEVSIRSATRDQRGRRRGGRSSARVPRPKRP
jgi:excinuclease ABC subunit B